MQLNEILEENSTKSISQKTNIPEEKINSLLNKEFDQINKVHALGFVSIIEREFNADLTSLKEEINAYYEENAKKDTGVVVGTPIPVSRRKTKWFLILVLFALGYATWHFLTQYDRTHLNTIFPINDESTIENSLEEKSLIKDGDLDIINVIKQKWADVTKRDTQEEQSAVIENTAIESTTVVEKAVSEGIETQELEESTEVAAEAGTEQNVTAEDESTNTANKPQEEKAIVEKPEVFIVPVQKLWFGLINMETKKRIHYSISESFAVNVKDNAWLAATSSAPFSLDDGVESKMFQDAREHYFKLDKEGIKELSKAEYIALGGWDQW